MGWDSASLKSPLGFLDSALAATQIGEANNSLVREGRAGRGQVTDRLRQHLVGLFPAAVPREHGSVVDSADAVQELDVHAFSKLFHVAAPLDGPVIVANPLAGVDQIAANPTNPHKPFKLPAECGCRGLVEAPHPLLKLALSDQR